MPPWDDPDCDRLREVMLRAADLRRWRAKRGPWGYDARWPRDRLVPQLALVGELRETPWYGADGWPLVLEQYTPDEVRACAEAVLTALALEDA